jgi:hypothetical protein
MLPVLAVPDVAPLVEFATSTGLVASKPLYSATRMSA